MNPRMLAREPVTLADSPLALAVWLAREKRDWTLDWMVRQSLGFSWVVAVGEVATSDSP